MEGALSCRVCQFLWCNYSHSGWFQPNKVTSTHRQNSWKHNDRLQRRNISWLQPVILPNPPLHVPAPLHPADMIWASLELPLPLEHFVFNLHYSLHHMFLQEFALSPYRLKTMWELFHCVCVCGFLFFGFFSLVKAPTEFEQGGLDNGVLKHQLPRAQSKME